MPKKLITIIFSFVILTAIAVIPSKAQGDEAFRIQLESVLSKFKNYRYSTISVYQINDISDIRRAIRKKEEEELLGTSGGGASAECVGQLDAAVRSIVENEVNQGATLSQAERSLLSRGISDYDKDVVECAYNYFLAQISGKREILRNAYVVTTRKSREELVPNTIIALIVSYDASPFLSEEIKTPSPANVYTYPEMVEFDLTTYGNEFSAESMYDLVINAFQQGMVRDRTLDAQGIGGDVSFANPKLGVSKSLIEKENYIKETDIQTFMRISQGQPQEITNKLHEVIVSYDLISYKRYEYDIFTYDDGYIDTISFVTNRNLPKYGVELKYGIDGINYPSLWSERMTLSAVWQNAKLGFILPTNGWSALSEEAFEQERRLTHGGLGVAGAFDFPVRIIPESGVFSFNFGFVFGDAVDPEFVNRGLNALTPYSPIDNDHMMRFNSQLHYTFGLSIDEDYHLRFGLGGTVYTVEQWDYESTENENRQWIHEYKNVDAETVGGISGRIEFMAKNQSTPYGATLQYFDGGIFGNLWLQIPIVKNTFALKLDVAGFNKAFGDTPRDWEPESIFIPSARFIINF